MADTAHSTAMDAKGKKRQLLQSMKFSKGSAKQVLGASKVKSLCCWNQERPYLAGGKRRL